MFMAEYCDSRCYTDCWLSYNVESSLSSLAVSFSPRMPMMPDPQHRVQPSENSKDAEVPNTVPTEPTIHDIAATEIPSKVAVSSSMGKPVRDSSWLELDICRDFVRGYSCPRGEQCRFAHPDQAVVTKENKVTCCYDFLKVCTPPKNFYCKNN